MTKTFLLQTWFDGERLRDDAVTVIVGNGLIESIMASVEPDRNDERAAGGDRIDARDAFVLPGLINTHVHIARAGFFEAEEPPLQLQQIVRNLQGALRAGVTTVADMGCTIPMLRALRNLTMADPFAGPRVVGAGPILTATDGYPFNWISPLWRHSETALAVDDARGAQRAVARTFEGGMDHVKIAVMHESFARQPLRALTIDATRAIVHEARALDRRVYAHAHSLADYRVSIRAGVTALMHSCFEPLSYDDVAQIRDSGAAVCPTLWAYDSTCQVGDCGVHLRADLQRHATAPLRHSWRRFAEAYAASGECFPPDSVLPGVSKASAREAMRIGATNLRLLHEAGVPIVFGNDASFGVALLARPIDELLAMHAAGLALDTCLRSATGGAADLLRRPELGRIAPGCVADFVLAPRRAASDLRQLDGDRPDVQLRVYVGGERLPLDGGPRRTARIARAYLEGTGLSLTRTFRNWSRSWLDDGRA